MSGGFRDLFPTGGADLGDPVLNGNWGVVPSVPGMWLLVVHAFIFPKGVQFHVVLRDASNWCCLRVSRW